jgi:hypothetical protein
MVPRRARSDGLLIEADHVSGRIAEPRRVAPATNNYLHLQPLILARSMIFELLWVSWSGTKLATYDTGALAARTVPILCSAESPASVDRLSRRSTTVKEQHVMIRIQLSLGRAAR